MLGDAVFASEMPAAEAILERHTVAGDVATKRFQAATARPGHHGLKQQPRHSTVFKLGVAIETARAALDADGRACARDVENIIDALFSLSLPPSPASNIPGVSMILIPL